MARKVICKRGRRLNVLRLKSKRGFFLRQKKNLILQNYVKKQSKIQLNKKEIKLVKNSFSSLIEKKEIKHKLKKGIEPGRVIIILAGPHRGKHAIVLKILKSGLLLITGPHKLNGLPLRRIHQLFTIVTSVKLDLSGIKINENIDDNYFIKNKKALQVLKSLNNRSSKNIFNNAKLKYELTEERKKDQIDVDLQIMEILKKHEEKKYLIPYLRSHFYLKNRQYPHKMIF